MFNIRLKNLGPVEGRIRLSEDEGPPANEFIADDSDDDDEQLNDLQGEYLTHEATRPWRESNSQGPSPPAETTSHHGIAP